MGVVKAILMVAFVIICILLVLLVMIQNDEVGGLGGLLSGSGSAAFGSRSASVISKTTFVLVVLFILDAFFIARLNKKPAVKQTLSTEVQEAVDTTTGEAAEDFEWYKYLDDSSSKEAPKQSVDAPAEE